MPKKSPTLRDSTAYRELQTSYAHPQACINRAAAYKGLPYARRSASDDYLLGEIFSVMSVVERKSPDYVPSGLSKDEVELALDSLVTPEVAVKLIKLYQKGVLSTGGKKPGRVQQWLVDYAATPMEVIMEKSRELWHSEHAAMDTAKAAAAVVAAERSASLQNLAAFNERQFTYSLLNDLFFENVGKGAGELIIGGISVKKHLSRYASNSGKNHDFQVSFSWTTPDGTPELITKESVYRGNRHNDAGRNWGLPE